MLTPNAPTVSAISRVRDGLTWPYSADIMVTDTDKMLKRLDESVQELRLFFRTHQQLTESEQLFVENRLMILQIEYTSWARDKLAKKKSGSASHKKTNR